MTPFEIKARIEAIRRKCETAMLNSECRGWTESTEAFRRLAQLLNRLENDLVLDGIEKDDLRDSGR